MGAMLEGITIIELGGVIAGNFGQVILADLGAEIIKIEPKTGDTARNASMAGIDGESAIHLFMNRGKKSVSIDLKTEEGLDILYRLVDQADVVIDNFRPGVLARLGIDHATLKRIKPDIITVSITGFGETGPLKDKPAFDLVIQAYSGHMSITGETDGPPARVGAPLADMSGAVYGCISILAALVGRGLHGTGAHADVAMLDSMVHLLAYDALSHLTMGAQPKRHGSAHEHIVPWQAMQCSDGFVVVAARDEKFFRNMCDAIERPDLKTDERTASNAARLQNRDWLVPQLEAAFLKKTQAEWIRILDESDTPSAPVNTFDSLFADPQIEARGMIQTYEHPTIGDVSYQPSPMKIDDYSFPNNHAPMLGEHTAMILTERLGYTPERVDELDAEGVVKAWKPATTVQQQKTTRDEI
ncbi:MAG: crotonobetainyl-CoA:carnitine CoA-transferase CaiB-like acyl-CoA transferase [Verrucomicrobiales bacterium]|jgi:crotonobetainyl-CoA:carnitine CoA-transferase CaiB-like acyl-CoA transferase